MKEKTGLKDIKGRDIMTGNALRDPEGEVYILYKGVDGLYLQEIKSKEKIWVSELNIVWDKLHFEIIDLEVVK